MRRHRVLRLVSFTAVLVLTANAALAAEVPRPIEWLGSCPAELVVAGGGGDGDGHGANDDFQYDLNGVDAGFNIVAANGELELWCIDGKFYALVWVSGGVRRFVGKCPFGRGTNSGTVWGDPATGNMVRTEWQSVDGGADDDGDGKVDQWVYTYEVPANSLDQLHGEDLMPQGDGEVGPPPTAPFSGGDLRPRTSTSDTPTMAGTHSVCAVDGAGPGVPAASTVAVLGLGAALMVGGALHLKRSGRGFAGPSVA